MNSKVGEMFPMETMATLSQGFRKAREDGAEASFAFLDVIMKDVLIPEKWELKLWEMIMSAYPISRRSLMAAHYLFSAEAQKHALFEYEYYLAMDDSPNNWSFYFTKASHLGVFNKNPDDVQTIENEFNALCRKCVPMWDQMHIAAQQRLEQLLDEVLVLKDPSGNRCYFDFASPIKEVVIPPLSKDDIAFFTDLAKVLEKDPGTTHLIRSIDELLKLLRFWRCTKHGHVEGYTDISFNAARRLLKQCIPAFDVDSPFVITERFMACCEEGLAIEALVAFLGHQEILCRPYRYGGTSLSRSAIHSYLDSLNAPSRLAVGIAEAAKQGYVDLLTLFLEDDNATVAVKNRAFIDDLLALLRKYPHQLKTVAEIYYAHHSSHSEYIRERTEKLTKNTCEPAVKTCFSGTYTIPEYYIVQELLCDEWPSYYDDRSFLYQAIAQQEVEDVQILQIGYRHDLELAKVAMKKDSAAFDYLSQEIQSHPDILRILEEEEYE